MSVRTRVGLIADDDGYFRVAASAILTRHFGFSEIAEVESFDKALEYLSEACSVCFFDVRERNADESSRVA
jgi:hypothetical protein